MATRCRLRLYELAKLSVAFFLGFVTKSLVDLPALPDSGFCPPCAAPSPEQEGDDLLAGSDQYQLREAFLPKTMYEVLRYDYLNSSVIFNNFDDNPATSLLGHQKGDLKDVLHQAMALLNSARPSDPCRLQQLVNGYRRFDPLRGEEYSLDVRVKPDGDPRGEERHTIRLVKPFGAAQLVSHAKMDASRMIHFLLPVTTEIPRFEVFLKNFQEVVVAADEDIYLFVVLFVGKGPDEDHRARTMKELCLKLSRGHKRAHVKFVQTKAAFSRAAGFDMAIKNLPPEMLLFFCDVDVAFTVDFLSRCRQNSVLGRQVFYPMVFAQYHPTVVRRFSPQDKVKDMFSINKYTGHWVHYGYGMACMYALDYRIVGGFQPGVQGWGGEDVDLYKKHVRSQLKVMRAADPGLIHRYHDKSCDPALAAEQLRMCRDSAADGLGAKQQLGKLLMEQHQPIL